VRKITSRAVVIVFAFLSLVPSASFVCNRLWPWPHPDSMPRVARVEFPHHFGLDIFKEFDQWFVDRVDRHLPLLAINAAYQIGLLRRSTDARVVIAHDGWLFYTDEGDDKPATLDNFRGKVRFTDSEVQKINRKLVAMHDVLAACGIHALVAVAPNKQAIYGEYLVNSLQSPRTALDDLRLRLDPRSRAMLIDLRQPLLRAKAQNPGLLLYYKTDTHWNQLGAFYAYRAIIDNLARTMPVINLQLASLDQYVIDVQPSGPGDIAINMLSATSWFTDTQVDLRGKFNPTVPPDAGDLMIVGDSFSDALIPYFKLHFSNVYFGYRSTAVEHGKPSVVLLECVERYLLGTLGNDFDWAQFCAR
jgi:hypothetical protein